MVTERSTRIGAADSSSPSGIMAGCTRTATPSPDRSQMASSLTVRPSSLAEAMSAALTSVMPSR